MATTTHAGIGASTPASRVARRIIYRTAGGTRGGITRLASPGDLGQLIKPFVFLDRFAFSGHGGDMGMHPHSGIATVTVVMEGAVSYRETTGNAGVLPAGGVEWMNAGGGVWHGGGIAGDAPVRGFQLWLALPPEDENGPAHSRYLAPHEAPRSGPARVVIGAYGGVRSPIATRAPINYLHVQLEDGERWTYTPPPGHDLAWVAPVRGVLLAGAEAIGPEIAVFEEGDGALAFMARGVTEFVLGSAARHPHELVTGTYSVHTSQAALDRGEREIARIGAHLRAIGQI
nr:pirin family protein [Massilia niastensis]